MKRLTAILTAILLTVALSAQIDVDKKYHAGAGIIFGVWGTFTGNSLELTPEKSTLFGMGSATLAGIGKETWDAIDKKLYDIGSGWDFADLGATMIGGAIGTGISYLGLKIFKKSKPYYVAVNGTMTMGIKTNF
jgi:uncharacterized protein YfiM (DUF2279 family)